MKPGDIIRIKLGHDVHEAEVVKENAKTVLVKVLWTKVRHRKVKEVTGAGQMNLSGTRVPYTVSGMKIIKIPKVKIVGTVVKEAIPSPSAVDGKSTSGLDSVVGSGTTVTESAVPSTPEPPPTPAPQETVVEEVLASRRMELDNALGETYGAGNGRPEPEYEGPGLGKDEAPLVEYPEPDPFTDLEAAIKEKTNE